jgi:hypothetical protein
MDPLGSMRMFMVEPGWFNARGSPMKFVFVNGRTPRPHSFCAHCCEPIRDSYVREIVTRFAYCDHTCYLGQGKRAAPAHEYHAATSVADPSVRSENLVISLFGQA